MIKYLVRVVVRIWGLWCSTGLELIWGFVWVWALLYSNTAYVYQFISQFLNEYHIIIGMIERYKKVGDYVVDTHDAKGKGQSGTVYSCQKGPNQYAMKLIPRALVKPNSRQQLCVKREKQNMLKLSGQNVICLHEYMQSNHHHYFVMEMCEGNLEELLSPTLSQEKAIEYLAQIVNGYKVLYKNKIIHRDLKPKNILRNGSVLKIADFGISRICDMENPENHTLQIGTYGFIAPEVFLSKYDYKADIWSIGVIFYLMLHYKMPWDSSVRYEIPQNKPKIIESLSNNSKDFINQCLKLQPEKRMSFEEMVDHPIFKNTTLSQKQQNYAEALMKQIIKIISESEYNYERASQSLDYYQTITNQLNISQFELFLKHICEFVDKTRAKIIFDFYKNSENSVPISMLRKMLADKTIDRIKQNQIAEVMKVKIVSDFHTI